MAIQNSNQQGIQKRLIPPGGTAGQIPSKKTAADYDVQWVDPPEGGGDAAEFQELTGELTFAILNALEVNKFYKITDATFTVDEETENLPDGVAYFTKSIMAIVLYARFHFDYPDTVWYELESDNTKLTAWYANKTKTQAVEALQTAEQNALLELAGTVYYDDLNDLDLPAFVKFNNVVFRNNNESLYWGYVSADLFIGYVYRLDGINGVGVIHPGGWLLSIISEDSTLGITNVLLKRWNQTSIVRGLTQYQYDSLSDEDKKGMIVITDAEPSGGGGSSGGGIPAGVVVIWSGASDAVPNGWALCDGTNGTPDLRDRFVLGAGVTHVVGESGGSEEVTLTVGQMPPHRHITYVARDSGSASSNKDCINAQILKGTNQWYTDSNNPVTGSSGSSQPHDNMPPYYTLAYIMKL